MNLSKEERAALNAMMLGGQLAAARCTERLLMDGETVLVVRICGAGARIEILPPHKSSALWREAGACKITQADITFVSTRFGCEIRWTLTRAEAELLRIADSARQVH